MQLVNLLQDGQPVRMSKRSGKAIALRDLLDEVSVDAARFFFNSRSSTSALDFGNQVRVLERVSALTLRGYTVLLSCHNPQHAML